MTTKTIPLDEAPKGATHYAHENDEFLASWYKLENGLLYGVNTHNAYRLDKEGVGGWYCYGNFLNRPINDLIKIV